MRLHEITDENPDEQQELTPAYKDTAEIPANVWPSLQAKIEKLNRKAARLKVPPVTLTITKEFFKDQPEKQYGYDPDEPTHKDEHGNRMVKEKYYEVKVEGAAPQVAGYQFLATIQHKDAGNIIRTVPGQENNENIRNFYESRPDYCDHCKKKRHRIDTFIVKGKDGNLRQVGRNCLADFIGGQDPKKILWYFSLRDLFQRAISDADEETSRSGRRREHAFPPMTILNAAAAIIRTYGYVKASQGSDEGDGRPAREPTSRKVRWALFDRRIGSALPPKAKQELRELLQVADHPTPEDEENTKKAVEWFNSMPQEEKDRSEFFHNIEVLLKSEAVGARDVGFLGAIFPSYHRATTMAKERAAQGTKKNEVVGVVGQKIPPTQVTVTRTQNLSGQYGTTQMCFMEDAEGRMFVWFNNSKIQLEQGQNITIVGTVKKHDDYKGRKQTVLTRVKAQGLPEKKQPAPVQQEKPLKWDFGATGA